jgi:hypothetical protein
VTDELEHTRSVSRPAPPALVEPPAPAGAAASPGAHRPGDAPAVAENPSPAEAPVAEAPMAQEPPSEVPEVPEVPQVPEEPVARGPYRLRMADGVVVSLDLTVYLGRRPSVPRIASDRRVRLVAVPSRQKEVSATHLELRRTGEAIVATDMRSTNGTIVNVPGSAPRTLLRGESAVVTPGSLIDLGDGNVLELLAPERIARE